MGRHGVDKRVLSSAWLFVFVVGFPHHGLKVRVLEVSAVEWGARINNNGSVTSSSHLQAGLHVDSLLERIRLQRQHILRILR